MVATIVLDVLPDDTVTEMALKVPDVMTVQVKRKSPIDHFLLDCIEVLTHEEKSLTNAIIEINKVLKENGIDALTVSNVFGDPIELAI